MNIGAIDMTAKWGWYNALWILAGERYIDIDAVVLSPFKQALTTLSYLKDKRYEANS